jgi:hypothetical protein
LIRGTAEEGIISCGVDRGHSTVVSQVTSMHEKSNESFMILKTCS